jgi:hypothetical protein
MLFRPYISHPSFEPKGDILGTIDTRLMNNSFASVSPCGRFFAVCGFTPDVKVWEVCFDKVGNTKRLLLVFCVFILFIIFIFYKKNYFAGNFKEIKRAFELKGHLAGIYSFSFNSDSTRLALFF